MTDDSDPTFPGRGVGGDDWQAESFIRDKPNGRRVRWIGLLAIEIVAMAILVALLRLVH